MMNNLFWERVKNELKKQSNTQIDMCEHTGIKLQTLRNKICKNISPDIDEVVKIADFLKVSTDYLLTGKEADPNNSMEVKYLQEKLRLINELSEQ